MKRKFGLARSTAGITSSQYSVVGLAPARPPHVRSKMEFSSNIAMSQRTPSHGPAQTGLKCVELKHIGPGGKVGVSSTGDHRFAGLNERSRIVAKIIGSSLNEVLRISADPGMIGRNMIGNEVEDKAQTALGKLL